MKNLTKNKSSFKLRLVSYLAALACLFFGSLQLAQAQNVTFAQFLEKNGTNDFIFTNNTSSATFSTVSGGSPIDFRYQNIVGLNPALQGFQDARLFMSATTTTPATPTPFLLTQVFGSNVNTIQILRDAPAPVGVGTGTRRNLLTVTFAPTNNSAPSIAGANGGNSASFSATTPDHVVTFTSDFLTFTNSTQRNWALSFSSILPMLSAGSGGFFNSFTAAGTGTFSANPAPIPGGPTAAAVSVGGRVLTADGRALRNAQVTITEADGSSRTVLTGNFGQFSFANLAAGQTVVLSVRSKRHQFSPQIITLTEDLNEIEFIAQP